MWDSLSHSCLSTGLPAVLLRCFRCLPTGPRVGPSNCRSTLGPATGASDATPVIHQLWGTQPRTGSVTHASNGDSGGPVRCRHPAWARFGHSRCGFWWPNREREQIMIMLDSHNLTCEKTFVHVEMLTVLTGVTKCQNGAKWCKKVPPQARDAPSRAQCSTTGCL